MKLSHKAKGKGFEALNITVDDVREERHLFLVLVLAEVDVSFRINRFVSDPLGAAEGVGMCYAAAFRRYRG